MGIHPNVLNLSGIVHGLRIGNVRIPLGTWRNHRRRHYRRTHPQQTHQSCCGSGEKSHWRQPRRAPRSPALNISFRGEGIDGLKVSIPRRPRAGRSIPSPLPGKNIHMFPLLTTFGITLPTFQEFASSAGPYSSGFFSEMLPFVWFILGFSVGALLLSMLIHWVMDSFGILIDRHSDGKWHMHKYGKEGDV